MIHHAVDLTIGWAQTQMQRIRRDNKSGASTAGNVFNFTDNI